MKLCISLTTEGQERHALGQPVYSWHFSTTIEDAPNGVGISPPHPGNLPLVQLDVALPDVEACRSGALSSLKSKEIEIQAEAARELRAVQIRQQNLLALTYTEVPF